MEDQTGIDVTVPPTGPGCVECERERGWWYELRRCAQCGHIGCCDTSPSQHATAHARATGHPLITSFEPGADWYFDYRDQQLYEGPHLAPPEQHPADQGTPGPTARVPVDWRAHLH